MTGSSVQINRNCELTANICHNITKLSKPQSSRNLVYQGSLKLINRSTTLSCKIVKVNFQSELVKALSIMSGMRPCDQAKLGMQCSNGTKLPFRDSEKTLRLLTMTTKQNDIFNVIDYINFENGRNCVNATFIMKKY